MTIELPYGARVSSRRAMSFVQLSAAVNPGLVLLNDLEDLRYEVEEEVKGRAVKARAVYLAYEVVLE